MGWRMAQVVIRKPASRMRHRSGPFACAPHSWPQPDGADPSPSIMTYPFSRIRPHSRRPLKHHQCRIALAEAVDPAPILVSIKPQYAEAILSGKKMVGVNDRLATPSNSGIYLAVEPVLVMCSRPQAATRASSPAKQPFGWPIIKKILKKLISETFESPVPGILVVNLRVHRCAIFGRRKGLRTRGRMVECEFNGVMIF